MALALRLPFDDEVLSTLIIEYVAEEQVADRRAFLRSILGCQTSSLVSMPRGLKRLSEETRDYWNLTAEEIARQLTCMPYHVASSPCSVAEDVLTSMTGARTKNFNRAELGFGLYSDKTFLRYCRQCIAEDRVEGRRPYFRRTQQLPGVAVCPKHGNYLTCSGLRASTLHIGGAKEYLDVFADGDDLQGENPNGIGIQVLSEVAKRSAQTLIHAEPSAYFDLSKHYKARLDEIGLMHGNGNCRLDELSSAMVSYFGRPYLSWLGLHTPGREARDWIIPLLCQGPTIAPTISHILLQQFLSWNSISVSRFGGGNVLSQGVRVSHSGHLRNSPEAARDGVSMREVTMDLGTSLRTRPSIDWSHRDEVYLEFLKHAANNVRLEIPPRRVSVHRILVLSKVSPGFHRQLKKLPQCREFLAAIVESGEQFRRRLYMYKTRKSSQ
ncbi:hypothetical protein G3N59_35405 [Paraburkholderia sp. Ac-20340]|uniref:TnsD family Tn7-like transposition protein n=1 Tax=Paraburkholderia sp. Ac-20340 TaxID=2703888 RepID=UPI00197CD445|nr:TnsD family Tn7-like transposition protein [Paraburkholderia sp. Ac-20340]MBN3858692.1 hypothetical protein [Paraburkholderia sp. Ac-20340]